LLTKIICVHFFFIESLKIGKNFQIQFDVRAQEKAGTLFYVDGNGDVLDISLVEDGSIKVVCNNGGGKFSVSYKPETSICNGDFYSVLLVKESKTLRLTVNGVLTEETTTKSSSSADTNSPAYFGGLPSKYKYENFLRLPLYRFLNHGNQRRKPDSLLL